MLLCLNNIIIKKEPCAVLAKIELYPLPFEKNSNTDQSQTITLNVGFACRGILKGGGGGGVAQKPSKNY